MRWSIIRLIWLRELRDQLRDRRTLFMIAVLPLVLYPILGYAVLQFALGFAEKPSVIGIVRGTSEDLDFPVRQPTGSGLSPVSQIAWLAAAPPGNALAASSLCRAAALNFDYPYFLRNGHFTTFDNRFPQEHAALLISQAKLRVLLLDRFELDLLAERKVDLILEAPGDFYSRLEIGEELQARPNLVVHIRQGDDRGRQAKKRLEPLLETWKRDLHQVRLARKGLPSTFAEPFAVVDPEAVKSAANPVEGIFDLVVRIFPFMLVMWSLAGALYPAVDLCAGEKERGTMETLLITPAGREEIVLGKFLTIWVFSAASALLNLLSMGFTTLQFGAQLGQGSMPLAALLWCVVLSLPLSALFSAISLAIGAYARSSKEGQYYLMPLFLVTMPLIFLTLAPGVELSPFYSLVPVTGVALLMQKLMTATSLAQVPWLYFIPVLAPIALYSWLALRWAIEQFQREEVLFREAERLDILLWLKSLLRDKEPTPTTAQAFFLFAAIIGLHWMSMGMGRDLPLMVHAAVSLLAFVAAPALFMSVMMHTEPRRTLFVRWPSLYEMGLAAVLAILLLPPLAGLATAVFNQFPHLTQLLEDRQPLVQELRYLHDGQALSRDRVVPYLLVFALLPALCEEVAFRGYILAGLMRRFRPRTAVILSSFLFALFHMNVFQFMPSFFLGVVLGLLTVRSKSLLPAIFFHFLHNSVLLGSIYLAREIQIALPELVDLLWPYLIGLSLVTALSILWWLYRKPYADLARELALKAGK
ncbi:MAG: CPBP family intramembrane metalloprotease [Planctomycetes bacterium]|nr:CPBP family intramembrane metalloprotease [Planctomycetota bacterium]